MPNVYHERQFDEQTDNSQAHLCHKTIQQYGNCSFGGVSSIVLLCIMLLFLQACYLFIADLPLCHGNKQSSYSPLKWSWAKCTHCQGVFIPNLWQIWSYILISKVLNTFIETVWVYLNIKLGNERKASLFHFSLRVPYVSDWWVWNASVTYVQLWHFSFKSPEKQLKFWKILQMAYSNGFGLPSPSYMKTYFVKMYSVDLMSFS